MAAASAYMLHVPENRREIILDRAEKNRYFPAASATVERFAHGRNAALIVLACLRDGMITHIANGRKGAPAGTGLVRLNMTDFLRLNRPIPQRFVQWNLPAARPLEESAWKRAPEGAAGR
jgi:hypothetical protein